MIERLSQFLFFSALLFAMWSPDAKAGVTIDGYRVICQGYNPGVFSSPDAAAAACKASSEAFDKGRGHPNCRFDIVMENSLSRFRLVSNSCGGSHTIYWGVVAHCPDGSAPNMSLPPDQRCPETCQPMGTPGDNLEWILSYRTGDAAGAPRVSGPAFPPASVCLGGCQMYTVPGVAYTDPNTAPNGYYAEVLELGTRHYGQACTGGDTPLPGAEPPPFHEPYDKDRCPPGTMAAGIDEAGTVICMGGGTKPNNPPPSTETTTSTDNPDGSKTDTTTKTTPNQDGSNTIETTTTTTNADGSKTTTKETTTTDTPDGKQGKNDSMSDFCKKNPTLSVCMNGEITGSCSTPITCKGDAVQCAIARQQMLANCRPEQDEKAVRESNAFKLGEQVIGNNDPLKETFPTKANAHQFTFEQLDTTGFLGSGECFSDRSVSMGGKSFVIPFSVMCPYLEAFRFVLMIISGLIALRILHGGLIGI